MERLNIMFQLVYQVLPPVTERYIYIYNHFMHSTLPCMMIIPNNHGLLRVPPNKQKRIMLHAPHLRPPKKWKCKSSNAIQFQESFGLLTTVSNICQNLSVLSSIIINKKMFLKMLTFAPVLNKQKSSTG